jgi:hypothetical protein
MKEPTLIPIVGIVFDTERGGRGESILPFFENLKSLHY